MVDDGGDHIEEGFGGEIGDVSKSRDGEVGVEGAIAMLW